MLTSTLPASICARLRISLIGVSRWRPPWVRALGRGGGERELAVGRLQLQRALGHARLQLLVGTPDQGFRQLLLGQVMQRAEPAPARGLAQFLDRLDDLAHVDDLAVGAHQAVLDLAVRATPPGGDQLAAEALAILGMHQRQPVARGLGHLRLGHADQPRQRFRPALEHAARAGDVVRQLRHVPRAAQRGLALAQPGLGLHPFGDVVQADEAGAPAHEDHLVGRHLHVDHRAVLAAVAPAAGDEDVQRFQAQRIGGLAQLVAGLEVAQRQASELLAPVAVLEAGRIVRVDDLQRLEVEDPQRQWA